MPEDEYSEAILRLHSLTPKMKILTSLFENLHSVETDAIYMQDRLGDLNDVRRKTYALTVALQILSLSIELIDDLAAYCFAFYRAKKENNRRVAEYLRDWGTGDREKNGSPESLFKKVGDDIVFAAEIMGLHPVSDWNETRHMKAKLVELGGFRKTYVKWYQGYKHGQRTLPVFSTPQGDEPLGPSTVWGIFMIPKTLVRYEQEGTKVYVDFDVSFQRILDKMNEVYEKATIAHELWLNIRTRVHQERFGRSPS